jgi:hypothetical protein
MNNHRFFILNNIISQKLFLLYKILITDAAVSGSAHVLVLDVHGAVLCCREGLETNVASEAILFLLLDHVVTCKLKQNRLIFQITFLRN